MIVLETIGAIQYDKEHQAKELQRRHKALMKAHKQIESDLDRAGNIQRKLVPGGDEQPFPEHVRLAHSFVPQMAVGGDYYDFRAVGDDVLAMLFVDVSGHGMSGAFLTGIIKTACDQGLFEKTDPAEFLETLNRLLDRMTPMESFAAVVFAVYNVKTKELRFANAGHHPLPLIVRSDGTLDEAEDSTGTVIGFDPEASFSDSTAKLSGGDRFVLCTDGITECANESGERFGVGRLREVLVGSIDKDVSQLPDEVLKAVNRHCVNAPQRDDRTILSMEVLK
jgi:serine phosphatase RsbU (regulator of sigma subunit)